MKPYDTNDDLVDAVAENADDYRVIERGPGGRPVIAAEAGGDKEPGIMLTAGAHATEQAGVVAAVELLDRLDTDYRVSVIPTRDPTGVDGFGAALETALGEPVSFDDYDDLADLLRAEATEVVDEDDVFVGLIGDYGFGTAPPTDDRNGWSRVSSAIDDLEGTDEIEPLRGRRVFMVPGEPDVEGTRDFKRLYTYVVSPDGEALHLNRFIGTDWAPAESRAVRSLFESTQPGLFVDIHEYHGDGNWVSVRPKADEDDRRQELEIGRAMIETIADSGARTLPLAELLGEEPDDDHFFSELETGLYDLDYVTRGEGFNATDYAAEFHGLAYTNETGMQLPFEDRVETAVASVERAVREYERLQE